MTVLGSTEGLSRGGDGGRWPDICHWLILGQQLNALGQIVTYERTEDGGYQESVRLRSG